tara:strand:- start:461 stop:892 length:432 start_codon:yes stop_codon:yes gene_type:complete
MANTIKLKRSSTASAVPVSGDLVVGELAINTADRKLYTKHGSTIVEVTSTYTHPNHSGDVVSAADGAMTIQTDAVDIAMLSATGTASSTTFLRGDNTWGTPSGSGGGGDFPFYKANGSADNITVTSGSFPFYKADGTQDNIGV